MLSQARSMCSERTAAMVTVQHAHCGLFGLYGEEAHIIYRCIPISLNNSKVS